MQDIARKITTREEAEDFCRNVMLTQNIKNNEKVIENILNQEILQNSLDKDTNTLNSPVNRKNKYRKNTDREKLRKRIAGECIDFERLDDERQIKLGKGGLKPKTPPKQERKFFCIIGLPGSGKSSISGCLSDYTGSYYLDSDIVKRKIPEYQSDTRNSYLVHEESNYILRSSPDSPEYNIMNNLLQNGANIVYNMIGDDLEWTKKILDIINQKGYSVILILMELDRIICIKRVYERFCKTRRYISLPVIFDTYSNNPTITYYKLVESNYVQEYAHLSNDVNIGENPKVIANKIKDLEFEDVFKFNKGGNKDESRTKEAKKQQAVSYS